MSRSCSVSRALLHGAAALLLSCVLPATAGENDLLEQAAAARQAYDAGQWETALQRYTRLAVQMPDDSEIRFRLGNVHARLGHLDEAAAVYRNLVERDPAFAKGWHNLALVRLQQAMAALAEAGRRGSSQDSVPSRRLLDALDIALSAGKPPAQECPAVEICPPPPPPPPLVVYTSGRVNLRSGCGTSHPKLAIVRAAARVEILDRSENCAQARIATGEIGWIPLSLLQLVPIEEGKHGP